MWPFAGFVNPALAWGVLFAAVPLIIHLLNRRRHKPLQWAAMRFVEEAYKRTRRRAQLENLLLLFLRMAAVGLLAFAVARPFTSADSALSPLTESRRDLVVVLDSSASTGYRQSVQSVHERIVERARALLAELDGTRGDRVRMIQAAGVATLLGGRSPEEATALLATLARPLDEPLDLAAAMAEVVALAEEEAAGTDSSLLEVRLLTDMQRSSFLPQTVPADVEDATAPPADTSDADDAATDAPSGEADPLLRALTRLEELGVRVIVEDLGPGVMVPPNLGIEGIEPVTEGLGVGITTDYAVTVRNFGDQPRNVRVALSVDGERLPSQRVDVTARGAAQVVFPVTFRTAGDHALVAELRDGLLEVDDSRALVVTVPEPLEVLLVNGDPRGEIDADETGILRAVLEPLVGDGLVRSAEPFRATTLTLAGLGDGAAVDAADVIVLANVDVLGPALVERIEARVAGGAALLIGAGDRMARPAALESWNARAWRPDGTGLLPARLRAMVDVPDRRAQYFRVASFEEEHPTLRFFADERWRPFLTEVPVFAFLSLDANDAEDAAPADADAADDAATPTAPARVLARLDDPQSSPLLLARDYGRGRVVLWTSSLDKDWNRYPELPGSFVPLVHELVRWAGAGPPRPRNLAVGQTLRAEVDGFPRDPELVRPDGARRPLDGAVDPVTANVWSLPRTPRADEAGLWKIEGSGFDPVPFAVSLDPAEGDLTRLGPGELSGLSSVLRAWTPGAGDDDPGDQRAGGDGELWRWLAGLALTALILETLWSAWIGRKRSLA